MKLVDLHAAGRSPALPLRLQLPEGELELLQWLRVLPGRRYVAVAAWDGRRVVAKLLVGRRSARHFRREYEGARGLAAAKLDAPEVLASGYSPGEGGWLLFEYLENAPSLGHLWKSVAGLPPLAQEQLDVLGPALKAIGTMHARGVWQQDLHLDNILCRHGKLYWIDAGSIRSVSHHQPLAADQAIANLGVFFAQLPSSFDFFIGVLLSYYQEGGGLCELPITRLRHWIIKNRSRRLRDYLRKVGRDCTEFSVSRGPMALRIFLRSEADVMSGLLANPDDFMTAGENLKNGNSATVRKVMICGRPLVLKRYNIKGFWHMLGRFWRPSRAWHAWREGNRLLQLGIPTARPLGMLENRCWGLRRRAYLVLEYLEGENIRQRFAPYVNASPPAAELEALVSLFEMLVRERVSHGDLKGNNLIWQSNRWLLIDLDAACQHVHERTFVRAYERDRTRFLRNWPESSMLYKLLDARLPSAYSKRI